MSGEIQGVVMPKWGMAMTEGTLVSWVANLGDEIAIGDEIAEVETDKMLGSVEAQVAGLLRRQVAEEDDSVVVGGLIAVIASADVSDADLDAFIVEAAEALEVAGEAEEELRTVTVEGPLGSLNAIQRGEGSEAVVLLHGFSGDALNWQFVIDELTAGRTVVAIDLPGHGSSSKEVGEGDVAELVASVLAVMDSADLESVDLVGHSLGALVAASLAVSQPNRVRSLALLAPAGFGQEIDGEFLDSMVEATTRRQLKEPLRKLFVDDRLVTRELVESVLRYKREPGVSEALSAIRADAFPGGSQRHSVVDGLAGLDAPLLVIWGSEDEVIPSDHAANAPDRARVEVLEGIGHSPHVEDPLAVAQLLLTHLGAVPAGSGAE